VRRHRALAAAVLALASVAARAGDDARLRAVDPAELAYTYAVGGFAPEYTPPAPGSYALPAIDTVTDHPLLDADGRPSTLFALTQGRLAVVAFVYTTCIEATGCPLSLAVLHRLDRAIAADDIGRVILRGQFKSASRGFYPGIESIHQRKSPGRWRGGGEQQRMVTARS